MNLQAIARRFNPWKRAAALERENQRLRDCLDHEEQRNFEYMFQMMAREHQRVAQIEAMNAHLMSNYMDIANLSPQGPIFFTERKEP